MAEEKALRYDTGKVGLEAILGFPAAMVELARVTEYGERKYARHNFRKGAAARQSVSCALRHLLKWSAGEENDPESGISHLAHAAWNVLRLLDETLLKPAGYEDDRHILEPARREILAAMIGGVVNPTPEPAPAPDSKTKTLRWAGGEEVLIGDVMDWQGRECTVIALHQDSQGRECPGGVRFDDHMWASAPETFHLLRRAAK